MQLSVWTAALLLAICPALGTTHSMQTLVAYATFIQLFRLIACGDAHFLRAVYRTHFIQVGITLSAIVDSLMGEAARANDIGSRRPHQIPSWFEKLAERCVASGRATSSMFVLGKADLLPIAAMLAGSLAQASIFRISKRNTLGSAAFAIRRNFVEFASKYFRFCYSSCAKGKFT